MKVLLALFLTVVPAAALAQAKPRTLADCEKIEAALAYNACLASFGPRRGERPAPGTMPQAEEGEPGARPARAAAGRQAIPGAVASGKRAGGRSFAVFDVTPAKGAAQGGRPRRETR
ncbi:hypothetical protein QNA08_05030 [Chelatococcus sp. SYSU_G07232]|uniref:Uncharacterized protein n=1 Tax=Chelatococcus albus TaxID=3047466 RepID=A0ABT7AE33_9HYPH|nr:hypothetical protein [Chelatococcus sp. SYSU_G07232]MDJ1157598.1 hypothetical protein [Chelatococcus sp. SYSU_G07232]